MKSPSVEEIEISVDGIKLAAFLHLPENFFPPLVIGCHGLFADAESPKQKALADSLSGRGIAFLRLNHRGCGKSGGDFGRDTTFPARLRDLSAARAAMAARNDLGRATGLFGSSMGGAVCLASALADPVPALCLYAAPCRFEPLEGVLRSSGDDKRLPPEFFAPVNAFALPHGHLENGPTLIFHGNLDRVVPVSHGREIFEKSCPPKELAIFPGGDHPMSDPAHQSVFIEKATGFFARFLFSSP